MNANQPLVSILVPVRNEERYIERCLYAIAAQDYPRDRIEVLVVDGMSGDRTRELVMRFAAESTLDVRVLDNPRRLPAAALNIGLREAHGSLIMRVDGHAAPAPDYLRRCIAALEANDAECAGGVLENEGETYVGRAIAAAMSSRFGVGSAAFRTGGKAGDVDTVAFGVYRADVFPEIGGFDETIDRGEDDEFNYRLRDAGGRIVLVPEARVTYTVRGDFVSLVRQYFGYGHAKPRVLALHPRQARGRQLAPAVAVASGTAAVILAARGRDTMLRRLIQTYALASIAASFQAARRTNRWEVLPVLPAVFACLHVPYALGFIAGIGSLAASLVRRDAAPRAESAESPFV